MEPVMIAMNVGPFLGQGKKISRHDPAKKNLAPVSKKSYYIKKRKNSSLTQVTSVFILKMLLLRKNSPDSLYSLAKIMDFLILVIHIEPRRGHLKRFKNMGKFL
jgi:hypothetical protein